jgi:hypothetical protein
MMTICSEAHALLGCCGNLLAVISHGTHIIVLPNTRSSRLFELQRSNEI